MRYSIEKRLQEIEKKLNPPPSWIDIVTSVYVYNDKEYKPINQEEKKTVKIIGLNPEAI
jgi:hypothetical protein